jgi:hypothetical protein
MPFIITSIHDPIALATTCVRYHLPEPEQGQVQLDMGDVHGWVIALPGLNYPIVCNTLTGLVGYHPADNTFARYGRIMRFLYRCYAVRHELRSKPSRPSPRRQLAVA